LRSQAFAGKRDNGKRGETFIESEVKLEERERKGAIAFVGRASPEGIPKKRYRLLIETNIKNSFIEALSERAPQGIRRLGQK